MKLRMVLYILLAVTFIASGCSGGGDTPTAPADFEDGARILSGVWGVNIDLENKTGEIVPMRDLIAHYNVTDIIMPPECDDCVAIDVHGLDPVTHLLDVDFVLRHHYLKTVYDVRLIVYSDDAGHQLTNADGWSLLWEKPGGENINPYISYATDNPLHVFEPGEVNIEKLLIWTPDPPQFEQLIFACDVSWTTNCEEPYSIENFQQVDTLLDYAGATAKVSVDVLDWQDDVNQVYLNIPMLTGNAQDNFTHKDGNTWEATITNSGATPGDYVGRIYAVSGLDNSTAVDKVTVTVSEALPDSPFETTPGYLNFAPHGITVVDDIAYVAAGPNGLHIFDVSDPFDPQWITSTYAGVWPVDVAVSGGYAYVADSAGSVNIVDIDPVGSANLVDTVGPTTNTMAIQIHGGYAFASAGSAGLYIIDIDPPESASVAKIVNTPGIAYETTVSGNYAYVADFLSKVQVIDISNIDAASIVKTITTAGQPTDVAVAGNILLAGDSKGVSVIDITDPPNAVILTALDTPGAVRDIIADTNYAVVTDADQLLHVLSINPPGMADIISSSDVGGVVSAMSLWGGVIFAADTDAGMKMFSYSPPLVIHFADEPTPGGAMDVEVDNGLAYIANSTGGLQIIDGTSVLKVLDTTYASDTAIDGTIAYLADEISGLRLIDIAFPDVAFIANSIATGGKGESVAVRGGYAYMGEDLLRVSVFDVDPVVSAVKINSVNLHDGNGVAIDGDYAYVAGGTFGLYIVNIMNPGSEYVENTIDTGNARDVAVRSGYAYIADAGFGVSIIDIDPPMGASVVKTVPLGFPDSANAIDVQGGFAYIAAGSGDLGKLVIMDIKPVAGASVYGSIDLPAEAQGVRVIGNMCYIADGLGGFRTIELW